MPPLENRDIRGIAKISTLVIPIESIHLELLRNTSILKRHLKNTDNFGKYLGKNTKKIGFFNLKASDCRRMQSDFAQLLQWL